MASRSSAFGLGESGPGVRVHNRSSRVHRGDPDRARNRQIDVRDGRCTLADGSGILAGSLIALATAVRNVVRNGASLPAAVAAASRNPLAMLGISDRGRFATGQRADLVELDDDLVVGRVMAGGAWLFGSAAD